MVLRIQGLQKQRQISEKVYQDNGLKLSDKTLIKYFILIVVVVNSMKRIFLSPQCGYKYRRSIKKKLRKEMAEVHNTHNATVYIQRYSYMRKIIFWVSRSCMILLLILTLYKILG